MKIYLKSRVVKQLARIPAPVKKLIIRKIETLAKNLYPTGFQKLTRREGFRVRVGDYSILYGIGKKKKEVTILSVAHRREAYK